MSLALRQRNRQNTARDRYVHERLGHSTIAITLDFYSHVSPILHDEAAQLVADLVLDG